VLLPRKEFRSLLEPEISPSAIADSSTNVREIQGAKGPVFATAIIAGVMAAKKTSELIPFCHPIMLDGCDIKIIPNIAHSCKDYYRVDVECTVKTTHKTGVEMEAMVGVSAASLCIYDMLKALSHDIQVSMVLHSSETLSLPLRNICIHRYQRSSLWRNLEESRILQEDLAHINSSNHRINLCQ
jgi:molybdenum cofactor biosynthesis protein MoaC